MTAEELALRYVKVSSAADVLRVDAAKVYRDLFTGKLNGLVIDGVRFVEIESIERQLASRDAAAV